MSVRPRRRLASADPYYPKTGYSGFSIAALLLIATISEAWPVEIVPMGQVRALVIFARFSDEERSRIPDFAAKIFDVDKPGSLSHFFREMSRGQFDMVGEVLPHWYASLGQSSTYLADVSTELGDYGTFVHEILLQVDEDFNLGRFDNDGPDGLPNSVDDDGFVDLIFVNLLTVPKGFIIGGATGISNLGLDDDFVTNDRTFGGRMVRIRADNHADGPAGTLQGGKSLSWVVGSIAHEFGHLLGLPDLYDTDINKAGNDLRPAEDGAGIGSWGLMGTGARGWNEQGGPNPFCAWSLERLGWLGIRNSKLRTVSTEVVDAFLDDVNAGGTTYKLPVPDSQVYYLVQYRSSATSYYERDLPAEGVLVWRINPAKSDNDDEQDKLVDLVCADGGYWDAGYPIGLHHDPDSGRDNLDFWAHDAGYAESHGGNFGDATDVFDGILATAFSAVSNPAAPFSVAVENIRREGGGMRADLSVSDRRRAGRIVTDEIWQDTVDVVGDVMVESGATLTIRGGAVVRFGQDARRAGRDQSRTELIIQGAAHIGTGGIPVRLVSASSQPASGDWYGIRVMSEGRVKLFRVDIVHAVEALAGSNLRRPVEVEELTVLNSAGTGINLENVGELVVLRGVEVSQASGLGATITGPATMNVFNSRFDRNTDGGLRCVGGFVDIRGNIFTDNGAEGESTANLVLGPQVSGNVLENRFGGGIGIRCQETGPVRIEANLLERHSVGLVSVSALPQIVGNTFIDNDLVLHAVGFGLPSRMELNAVEAADRLLDNKVDRPLRAINNWWGRDDAAWISERILGEVKWRPYLNFDPRLPVDFALQQNYPNPFNGLTTIDFSVGIKAPIVAGHTTMSLQVRNITGGLVRGLVNRAAAPGFYTTTWNGCDQVGRPAASGVYYYQLRVGPIILLRRLLLLR